MTNTTTPQVDPSAALYRISWEGYTGDPPPENHTIDWFSDDLGFKEEDRVCIELLAVGESYVTGGPADTVTIVRLN